MKAAVVFGLLMVIGSAQAQNQPYLRARVCLEKDPRNNQMEIIVSKSTFVLKPKGSIEIPFKIVEKKELNQLTTLFTTLKPVKKDPQYFIISRDPRKIDLTVLDYGVETLSYSSAFCR